MKKIILLVLILGLLIPLNSCIEKKVEIIEKLTPLLYERSAGGVDDINTTKYTGEKFLSYTKYEKNNKNKKTIDAFGNNQTITYRWTWKYNELPYELDVYDYIKDTDAIFVAYRTDTNKIIRYQKLTENNREYKSSVTPYSLENEYISYAKMLFVEYAGISLDDWDIKIQTWRDEYGYEDGFINYAHNIPSNNAEYIITFSKKIKDINRCDDVYVRMTNVGEVIEFNAFDYSKAFEPFESIQIDKAKIENEAWNTFNKIKQSYHNVSSEVIKSIILIPQGNTLWAQVSFEYRLGETKGAISYVIEIAKLK